MEDYQALKYDYEFNENNNKDIYDEFNDFDPNFDLQTLKSDKSFKTALEKSNDKRPPPTAAKLGTPFRSNQLVPPSRNRPITASHEAARPMTAVRAAGYNPSSQTFISTLKPDTIQTSDEEKVRKLEKEINHLIDQSTIANQQGDLKIALEKAEEADRREKGLIDLKSRLISSNEQVNVDLTYAVKFNLANQQAANNLDHEAIATFQTLVKNKTFNNSGRLKVNIGNIHLKLRQYEKAIRMYKMALDQVSDEFKNINTKIRMNISIAYVKMQQFSEAATMLELVMDKQASVKVAFNLTLCYYLLNDKELMKRTFERMVSIETKNRDVLVTDENKYVLSSEDKVHNDIVEAIHHDELRKIEKQRTSEENSCIMMAAKMISRHISSSYAEGYDWCINQVKSSPHTSLAYDLDIDKAIGFLKQKEFQQSIQTLKSFEKKDSRVASVAATNLSFLYFLENDEASADKYSEVALQADKYNPSALVNKGNVLYRAGDWERASGYYKEALTNDSSCVEALYNYGLTTKRLGKLESSLDCFLKLHSIMTSYPQVMFQIADVYSLMDKPDQAKECLMQVNSMVPSDAVVMLRLAEMYEVEDDKVQALHYYSEACKLDPTNVSTLEWLGGYFLHNQMPENAVQFFEKGACLQPGQAKWLLMVASCYKRMGGYQQAFELYKYIHRRFPENIECLKILTKLCVDMNNNEEAGVFKEKMVRVQKLVQLKEERTSSGRQRSGRMRVERDEENDSRQSSGSLRNSDQSRKSSDTLSANRNKRVPIQEGFEDKAFSAAHERPRTASKRKEQEDFEDEEIGDDLLPD